MVRYASVLAMFAVSIAAACYPVVYSVTPTEVHSLDQPALLAALE